jgi:hypothetical protein
MAGFDAPEGMAAACLRWDLPRPGGLGLAASAAFFMRSARAIGLSVSVFGSSLMALT